MNKIYKVCSFALYTFLVGCVFFSLPLAADAGPKEDMAIDSELEASVAARTLPVYDPIESFNRGVYSFNRTIDSAFIIPMVNLYRAALPETGRRGIRNFLSNLLAPVSLLNNLLQGNVQGVFTTFWRFALNTTFGVAGFGDFAGDVAGLKPMKNDFGRTLGVYGVSPGAYVVLPILGPYNARDAVGFVADSFSDPFNYMDTGAVVAKNVLYGIDKRESLLDITMDIERNAIDPYAATRSMYTQNRAKAVERSKEKAFSLPPRS